MATNTAPLPNRGALACMLLDRLAAAAPDETGVPGRFVSIEGARAAEYQLGLLDFLAALGIVEQRDDGLSARPVSPLAGWALRILCDIFDSGEPLVGDWHSGGRTPGGDLRHPFAKAADLLAALDRRRYDLLPSAAPVRETRASVGILPRRSPDGRVEFLLFYDEHACAWQLPGGRPDPGDGDARETLLRELGEELCFAPQRLARLSLIDLFPALRHTRESPTYGPRSRTIFTPFLVLGAEDVVANGDDLRWVGETEVRAGRTADGAPIAVEPLVFFLDRPEFDLRLLMESHSLAARV